MTYMKVKDRDDIVRDKNSKAILNVDTLSYAQHVNTMRNKERVEELSSFQTEVKDDINTLKQQMSQLQELILKSLENKT